MFQEGESGSEESSDEMDQNDDNSNSPEDIHHPPECVMLPTNIKKEKQTISQSMPTISSSTVVTTKSNSPNPFREAVEEPKLQKLSPISELQKTTANTTLPLIVPTTANSTNLSYTMPSISLPNATPNQMQAVPLLLQTPNGMGYASTPDGMILGLLQGPNMVQPQLVALPFAPNMPQNPSKAETKEKKS